MRLQIFYEWSLFNNPSVTMFIFLYCHCLLTTWFWAQMDTTPLEMEAIIGRTGCHWTEVKGEMGKLSDFKQHCVTMLLKFHGNIVCQCLYLRTVSQFLRSLPPHPAAALLWFHEGSSPGCRCSSPRCRARAAGQNRPRCTRHRRRNSNASTESWMQNKQIEYISK